MLPRSPAALACAACRRPPHPCPHPRPHSVPCVLLRRARARPRRGRLPSVRGWVDALRGGAANVSGKRDVRPGASQNLVIPGPAEAVDEEEDLAHSLSEHALDGQRQDPRRICTSGRWTVATSSKPAPRPTHDVRVGVKTERGSDVGLYDVGLRRTAFGRCGWEEGGGGVCVRGGLLRWRGGGSCEKGGPRVSAARTHHLPGLVFRRRRRRRKWIRSEQNTFPPPPEQSSAPIARNWRARRAGVLRVASRRWDGARSELGRRGRGSSSIGERAGEKWGTTSVGDIIWLEGRRGLAEEGEDTKRRYETRNTKVGEEEEDQEG